MTVTDIKKLMLFVGVRHCLTFSKARQCLATTVVVTVLLLAHSAFAQEENPFIPPAQKFFELMESGKYHDAYQLIDTSVTKMASEEKIVEGWKQVRRKFGKLKGLLQTRVEERKPYNSVFMTMRFDSAVADLKIVFK